MNLLQKSLLLFIASTGTLATTAKEQPGSTPLTIEQAVSYAITNNVKTKNARLDVLLQKAQNAEITGQALPQVSIKDNFSAFPKQITSFIPAEFNGGPAGTFTPIVFTPKYANTALLEARQTLFDATILLALKAKKYTIELSQLAANASERDVRYSVQRSYYALVVAQKQYEILKESVGFFRSIYSDLQKMYEVGVVEKIEVDRTEVQLNNLVTDSLSTGNFLELSEQLLKYNMGMDISRPITLTDTSLDALVTGAPALLLDTYDYTDLLEYNQLNTSLTLNSFDIRRRQYQAFPTLSVFGNLAETYSSNKFSEVASPSNYIFYSTVGVSLNIPLFTGFQRVNQLKQARLTVEKTQNSIDNLKLGIDLKVAQSRTTLKNALLTLETGRRNLSLANSVLDLARKKYNAGVGSNLEVTTAQSEYLKTQATYFGSLLDVVNARTDVELNTGGLNN